MELIAAITLYLHIIAGAVTLLTGPVAIFYNFKDPKKHRLVGKVFYYAMLFVVVSAIAGFFKDPGALFRQFLLGISLLVLAGILKGVRAIFLMKGGQVLKLDWAYTMMLAVSGIWMMGTSIWNYTSGGHVAFSILFAVFGIGSMVDVRQNYRVFSRPDLLDRLDWMNLHSSAMIGAFIASTTAFTVNAAPFLPWWAQWFGPTLLLVPVQVYFGRKIKGLKEKKMSNSVA